ncbi:hypothetical protein ACUSIJ_24895 [Pseudochelatococcus sp. B33]
MGKPGECWNARRAFHFEEQEMVDYRTGQLVEKVAALEGAVSALADRIDVANRVAGTAGGAFLSKAPNLVEIRDSHLRLNSGQLVDAEPADPLTLRHPGGNIIAVLDGHVVLKEGFNYTVDKEAGTVTLKYPPAYPVRFLFGG